MLGTVPDLLRLVAVPVLGYAAWRDVRTRRVPNAVWYPLYALGAVLLCWEGLSHLPTAGPTDTAWLVRVGVSLGFVAPLSYLFWRLGGFGGADAKAFIALAVLVPTFPRYYLSDPSVTLPVEVTTLGVFSMTILTNTVLLGILYPVALGVRNALAGRASPAMFLARRVPVQSLPLAHGRLFETREGFTRGGLDLDALRMYLRWRGTTLAAVRESPDTHRDPASVGETYEPTDGAVHARSAVGGVVADGGVPGDVEVDTGMEALADADAAEFDDPWAAAAFLDAIEGSAYGTSPATLREGLETATTRDEVWISPGIPFIVPLFVGCALAFVYGDLLFGLLSLL